MKYILSVLLLLFMTGCGHHIMSYTKGAGMQVSWTPDSFTPNARIGFYEFLFSMNRENAHIRYSTNLGAGSVLGNDIFGIAKLYALIADKKENPSNLGSGTVIQIKTGPMMNGYIRDILNNPQLNQYHADIVKSLSSIKNELSDRETIVTPFETNSNKTPVAITEKGAFGDSRVSTPVNEVTKNSIEKQVKPNNIFDNIRDLIGYIILSIFIIIILILVIKNLKNIKSKNKEN